MSEVIRGFGSNVDTLQQVDSSYDAARVSMRPIETQPDPQGLAGGHYFLNSQSGLMAAGIASAAQVWQLRWAPGATILFGLKKLKVQCSTCTGFAATTIGAPLQLFVGHGSTANGSGGTAVTVPGGKGRAAHSNSLFAIGGEVRIATTAALTAATGQTLEGQAVGGCMGADNRTLVSTGEMFLFEQRDFGDHPLILLPGDTLAILTLNPAATGTWQFTVSMSWLETAAY